MSEQKPKLGKKGTIGEIAKKLTELRQKPISELNERIKEIVKKQVKLRAEIDAIVADLEGGSR